jgi:hydrogenase nickel incorporation protein HypB
MCGTCGCGEGEKRVEELHGHSHTHAATHTHADGTTHTHADGTTHSHPHSHGHVHSHANRHTHDHPHEHHVPGWRSVAAQAAPAGADGARLLSVERDILARNDAIAQENRRDFHAAKTLALNLVSSPGSGKTSLLVETLKRLGETYPVAVIEGDQETTADADRIRATGVAAIQINTGKGCHLDADLVRTGLSRLGMPENGVLFIENVGNLVCPAGFDLGEAHKVVIVSVPEGEDKPLKYSGMFAASALMVVTKTDLLPHLDFDIDRLIDNARRINPAIGVLKLSAKSGEGMDRWMQWIERARALRRATD